LLVLAKSVAKKLQQQKRQWKLRSNSFLIVLQA